MIRRSRRLRPSEIKSIKRWMSSEPSTTRILIFGRIKKIYSDTLSTSKKKSTTRQSAKNKMTKERRKRLTDKPNRKRISTKDKKEDKSGSSKMKKENNVKKKENKNFKPKKKLISTETPTGELLICVSS